MTVQAFARAAGAVGDLIGRIELPAWDGPGLGEWDLRALVGHTSRSLVTVLEYLGQPAPIEQVFSAAHYYAMIRQLSIAPAAVVARGRDAGTALGPDPAIQFAELVRLAVIQAERTDLGTLVTCIAGGIRVGNYLPTRTFELVVHGFDIARATGLPFDPPHTAQVGALRLAAEIAVEWGRGKELLLALTGRSSLPVGFTLV